MNPDEPLRTKNLAEEDPAPMDDTLDGYPWAPRMIDKARASAVGALGNYFKYPCPIDCAALGHLDVTADDFAKAASESGDGREVMEMLAELGANFDGLRSFDPVGLNSEIHGTGS